MWWMTWQAPVLFTMDGVASIGALAFHHVVIRYLPLPTAL